MREGNKKTCWGILGTGNIADKFVRSCSQTIHPTEIVSAASRTPDKASHFAKKWGIPEAYSSYEDLLENTEIDIVYISNTHNFHLETAILALSRGVSVLIEKPMGVNASDIECLIDLATKNNCFMMEAMWTRFLPTVQKAYEWVRTGRIGPLRTIEADFCVTFPFDPENRLYNMNLAGGALLDLGIYPLALSSGCMEGALPDVIQSMPQFSATGSDQYANYQLLYPGGVVAELSSGCSFSKVNSATFYGQTGRIELDPVFIGCETVRLYDYGKKEQCVETFQIEPIGEFGFQWQIDACITQLRKGESEHPLMPWRESLNLAKTMDRLRRDWGMIYPFEESIGKRKDWK